jgi:hypothetical protein
LGHMLLVLKQAELIHHIYANATFPIELIKNIRLKT